MRRAAPALLALLAVATTGCPARPPAATPVEPTAPPPAEPPASPLVCSARHGEAEVWRAPCALDGGRLASRDGALLGELAATDRGERFTGSFRGAAITAEFFTLGDLRAAAVAADGVVLELSVEPAR
jgi:hypothetical protein